MKYGTRSYGAGKACCKYRMRNADGNVKDKNREKSGSSVLDGLRDTQKSEITFKIRTEQKWGDLAIAPKSSGNSIYLSRRRQISILSVMKKWCRNFGQCTTIDLSLFIIYISRSSMRRLISQSRRVSSKNRAAKPVRFGSCNKMSPAEMTLVQCYKDMSNKP